MIYTQRGRIFQVTATFVEGKGFKWNATKKGISLATEAQMDSYFSTEKEALLAGESIARKIIDKMVGKTE